MTPDIAQTKLDVRGFHYNGETARAQLETVGESFLTGFGHAAEAPSTEDLESALETVPYAFKGFAYEGAAMALTILDALPFGRSRRVARFLDGRGGTEHVYMAYVGIGWAMARLPRFRWPKASAFDPLLRWLVLDGYGFHQAYFRTDTYVHEQHVDTRFDWPGHGPRADVGHVIDQGVGRAMWFVGGADPAEVARLIGRFPERRHADLFSGAALAVTYAGGVDEQAVHDFARFAGEHRGAVAQGAAFAAEARVRAGLVLPHTATATRVLCGTTPEHAARITQDVRAGLHDRPDASAYQTWRRRIADQFVSLGGVAR
jgi:hypothetical protein